MGADFTDIRRNSLYTVAGTTALLLEDSDDKTTEWNLAGFLSYGFTLNRVKLNAGLRYEHVSFKFYSKGNFVEEQSKTYNNLFPDVFVNFPISKIDVNLPYRKVYEHIRKQIIVCFALFFNKVPFTIKFE